MRRRYFLMLDISSTLREISANVLDISAKLAVNIFNSHMPAF
jgi:hypothetical protein